MSDKSRKSATSTPLVTPADALEYRQLIERLAMGGVNQRIPNGVPLHASILLEAMFRHAKADIRIFTGVLSEKTYDYQGLIVAARRFLSRPGSRLKILLQKPQSKAQLEQRQLIRVLTDVGENRGDLDVRCAQGVYATEAAKHFAVMDEQGFRFEIDHENTRAIANFNEPDLAAELTLTFDRAFSLGAELV